MDKPQRISDVASSSNSSSAVSSQKYDVFLSFRGEDTRFNFTSHLYNALMTRAKIETFIDNRLEKGDEISAALIKAIEDSHICIVIFSENYATSKWCLNELNKIMDLKKEKEQLIVIPVFYKVDPSHVRYQTGSYKEAFAKHEGHSMCSKWKAALTEAANLSGWHCSQNRSEAELLEDIVQDVLQKLAHTYPIPHKKIVGIERSLGEIESLLKIGSKEVITLGIWGMGGIGKTTLATALYDKLSYQYEGRCFLANVREKSENLEVLCKELSSELLGNKNHDSGNCHMSRLPRKKYFIVLDDVSDPEQLENLIEKYDIMGAGSRVIVTARDKQILSTLDEIFPVGELDPQYSLQLFCLSVFGEKQPKEGYEHLSQKVISYCKGVPLALKVLGASLRGRSKEAWESVLSKLQKIPNMKIHNVLKLSYDGLDRSEKDIFLDIACFFKGKLRDTVTEILDAFDFFPAVGIEVLLDKALVTISNDNRIEMHDLIEEMGREIVHQESKKYPEKRSRLWKHEDVLDVLKYNKGTGEVEGLILNLYELKGDQSLSPDFLAKMNNLRFLEINGGRSNVYFPDGLESLSNKLRWLHWDICSLVAWPPNFCAEQLVQLRIRDNNFEKLWDGIQNLINLKSIDVSYSDNLVELPDLSKAAKLENVSLSYCHSLRQLHPSILSLPKLTILDLYGCEEIESLESNVHSKSLKELTLGGCSSLKKFSVTSDQIKELNLSESAICALSPSIGDLFSLEVLDLSKSKKLVFLPKLPSSLIELDLRGCSEVMTLPKLPSLLEKLYLSDCQKLMCLPKLPSSLIELDLSNCEKLESPPNIPSSVIELQQYQRTLDSSNCKKFKSLPELPQSLILLDLSNREKLKSLQELPSSLRELDLSNCEKFESLPELPSSLRKLGLSNCKKLESLPELPSSLKGLYLNNCEKFKSLPELPESLIWLYLDNCKKFESLPMLPPSVKEVSAYNCTSLQTDMTQGLVLRHMAQSRIPYLHQQYLNDPLFYNGPDKFIFPGDHIKECGFHTTSESLITIPCLPKSDLVGFICCVNLSKQQDLHDYSPDLDESMSDDDDDYSDTVRISINQDDKEVGVEYVPMEWFYELYSDHVLFSYVDICQLGRISEVDDQFGNITFRFQLEDEKVRIKGCGVFPVYATTSELKLVNNSNKASWLINSGSKQLQLLEWESNTQISADEPQAKRLRITKNEEAQARESGVCLGGSDNKNEDERKQFLEW